MKAYLILCSILCCTYSLNAQLSLQDSLIAWYPFDGDALDYSGNANHGTVSGASLATDRFGNANSAYFFDGNNDFISFTNNQAFKPDFPITITAWVKINDYGNNVIFNNDFSSGVHYGFWLNIVNGNLYISYGNGGPANPSGRRSIGGGTLLQLNQWYHVAGIVRAENDMELFINGKRECGTYSGTGGPLNTTSGAGTSGRGTNTGSFYHGNIDEIRFYSRDLDKSEIRLLADFPPQDTTFCEGDSLQLDAGYGNLISWNPTTNLSCTNCPNPIASPIQSTLYTAITENTPGCPDTVDISILTKTCPTGPCDTVNFDLAFNTVVNGNNITIYDQSSIPTNAQMDIRLGDGNSIGILAGDSVSYTYNNNGTYTICLEAVLALGETLICSDTICETVELLTTSIEAAHLGEGVKIFPNPSLGILNLEFTQSPETGALLHLYDLQGKSITSWKLNQQLAYQFDLSSLPKGRYFLRIEESNYFHGSQLLEIQ